jgi:hypothetical protein
MGLPAAAEDGLATLALFFVVFFVAWAALGGVFFTGRAMSLDFCFMKNFRTIDPFVEVRSPWRIRRGSDYVGFVPGPCSGDGSDRGAVYFVEP